MPDKGDLSQSAADRLGSVSTLPDFIIETLSISLDMNKGQSAALIASNQKFLVHLCVKGMKGKDYSKLKAWYKLLHKKTQEFIDLCEKQRDDRFALPLALNVIKCGLFSHNFTVADQCCSFLVKIWSEVSKR